MNHTHITVKMVAQSYSPSDSTKPGAVKTVLSASAVATIIVSMLALTGILGTFIILTVKLSSGLTQRSNENQPLLKDRYSNDYSPSNKKCFVFPAELETYLQ